jgi:hypothetical protein
MDQLGLACDHGGDRSRQLEKGGEGRRRDGAAASLTEVNKRTAEFVRSRSTAIAG